MDFKQSAAAANRFLFLETTGSTNADLVELATSEPNSYPNFSVLVAGSQTAGRGRMGRQWVSPPGKSLAISVLIKPDWALGQFGWLPLVAGVAMKQAVQSALPESDVQLKWPNDVQLNSKKLSGVLCETSFHDKTVDLFLGIGLNVNMEAELLSHVGQPATSLMVETGKEWDRSLLLKKILKQFAKDLESFKKEGFTPFHNQYENLLAYKGHTIHCFDGQKEWVGVCHSITNDGQLNLYLPNKEILTLSSGDLLTAPEGS
jgi:BirA family biotin operon repressor/biotin-[acetyl-CoA-carboxylase] ligase